MSLFKASVVIKKEKKPVLLQEFQTVMVKKGWQSSRCQEYKMENVPHISIDQETDARWGR